MSYISRWHPQARQFMNWAVTVGSVILCLIMLPTRLPGMELLGIAPNWLLVWVVVWSVKHTALQGAIAGLAVGFLQDGISAPIPTHALSLAVVGIVTARLQKQRYLQENFISLALIVFGMVILADTITALQFSFLGLRNLAEIWTDQQRITLSCAILSSLWAPVVYCPLNWWWEQLELLEQS